MRRIRIPNPKLSNSERTFLDSDYSSGTSLTVLSNLGFAANDYSVVGEVGEEKTESRVVSSISSTDTIVIGTAYSFDHNKSTTLYRSEWNQIILERKLATSTTWSNLSTFNIQWDKLETLYVDPSGDDTYDYRFRFYNSTTVNYSEYSPTVKGSGFTRKQVGSMIINVRKKIRDPNKQGFGDGEIIQKLQEGQTMIETLLPKLWFLKVDSYEASNGITSVAGTSKYSLASYSDLNFVSKIRYKYASGTTEMWDLEPTTDINFDQYDYNVSAPHQDDNAGRFKLIPPDSSSDQGYFKVYPIPKTTGVGTFYPIYFKKMTTLDVISDATNLPFPEILEDYAAWKLHDLLGNTEEADKYRKYFFGPNSKDRIDTLTGVALLEFHNDKINKATGYGRSLWQFRGRRAGRNFFPGTIRNRDYIKEFYM